jgi:nucleotide-binding universal stress UspA family protein
MISNLVVVGIDGSAASRVAMEWAADYARMLDARLKAVHVRPAADVVHPSRSRPMFTVLDGEEDDDVTAIFESVDPEPGWMLTTVDGTIGPVLVEAAEHAVLLVVGSRQAGGLDGVRQSSVSRYCTLHARTPVLVCPDLDAIRTGAAAAQPAAVPVAVTSSMPAGSKPAGRTAAMTQAPSRTSIHRPVQTSGTAPRPVNRPAASVQSLGFRTAVPGHSANGG